MHTLLMVALLASLPAQTTGGSQVSGVEVTLTGTLRGDRIAAGGETTGWALEYRDGTGATSVEVELPAAEIGRARSGTTVSLTGTFTTRQYAERGPTRVFRVNRLSDGAGAAGQAPPRTSPRLSQLTLQELTPEQRALADEILKVSSLGLGGPYNPMLRSPEMGERLFKMLDYLRFKSSVPRRLNEFAILIQARHWTSQVEWLAHYPLAIKEGLSESTAAELKAGLRPTAMKPDEAAVYDLCMEVSTTHTVSDATYRRAAAFLTEQQVVDLVTVSGTYATLAMLMNTFAQGVPPGATPPLLPMPAR